LGFLQVRISSNKPSFNSKLADSNNKRGKEMSNQNSTENSEKVKLSDEQARLLIKTIEAVEKQEAAEAVRDNSDQEAA